jgi:hypothetical protein
VIGHSRICGRAVLLVLAMAFLGRTVSVSAQDGGRFDLEDGKQNAPAVGIAKGVVADPTTYLPAVLFFASLRLDWASSQPLFQHGFVEGNARYTVSGYPHDVPVSYSAGNRRIAADALMSLSTMVMHNAANQTIERLLIDRFPAHRKLLTRIGWMERSAFASYLSYQLSAAHFRQWQLNESLASQLAYP